MSIAPTQKRTRDSNEPDSAETDNKKPRVATTPAETHMATPAEIQMATPAEAQMATITETSVATVTSETHAAVAAPVARAEDVDIVELVSIFVLPVQ